MKYIIIKDNTSKNNHLIMFEDRRNHSNVWNLAKFHYPSFQLLSAGKLYIEPSDVYPDLYNVQIRPGSSTLDLNYRSQEHYDLNYNLALELLGGIKEGNEKAFEFYTDEDCSFSSDFPLLNKNELKRNKYSLNLKFNSLKPGLCPMVTPVVKDLNEEMNYYFWCHFKYYC